MQHRKSDQFAVELRLSAKTGAASVVRLVHGFEEGAHPFGTLTQALQYIEEHHWIDDIIDMPAGQQLLA